jgi:hypothetical protein
MISRPCSILFLTRGNRLRQPAPQRAQGTSYEQDVETRIWANTASLGLRREPRIRVWRAQIARHGVRVAAYVPGSSS